LQVVWSTVMSEGSYFLISLGLKHSVVSLVWLAGPVCGTVLQPYIGHKSDFCTHSWGRRRPFMVYGTIATIICINSLSWTSEAVTFGYKLFGTPVPSHGSQLTIQILAVIWVWALNIAIQPVQAGIRALIVDSCPASQAVQANSCASFIVIIGSTIGYACALLEMPTWIENSQFQGLCLLASILLGTTVAITSIMIEERPVDTGDLNSHALSVLEIWTDIYRIARILPPIIKKVCLIQFFSWLAWFPFLFNIVIYLSKLYEFQILGEKMARPSRRFYDALHKQSIQHAVLVMLVFSIVALLSNLCLPYLVITTPYLDKYSIGSNSKTSHNTKEKSGFYQTTSVPPVEIPSFAQRYLPTLPQAWMLSHVLISICLFGATFGDSFMFSVSFVSLLGVSWTFTQWAPFAIISAEIAGGAPLVLNSVLGSSSSTPVKSLERAFTNSSIDLNQEETQSLEFGHRGSQNKIAGTIMGIHNIAIAMPQLISSVLSSLIYLMAR
ncbi:hypothetical protein BGZ60DRAFT_344968, partial [Tricladium varicosporioides]